MTSATLAICGATVVTPEGAEVASVVVEGETIVDILPGKTTPNADHVIDATGKIVLPGGVDAHTHFLIGFMGQRSVYDFFEGSVAALRGGTTSFVDFALQRRGRSMMDGLKHRRVQADGHTAADYGLHLIVTDVNSSTLAEIPELIKAGMTTFKAYMVYETEQLRVPDGPLIELMEAAGKAGMMVGLHAENSSIIDHLTKQALEAGHKSPPYHALTRPPISEHEAIVRALTLAESADVAVHIFHMSLGSGVDAIAAARACGVKAFSETCTHYLALTDDKYAGSEPWLYVMSPPLRKADDQDRLWEGLRQGLVSTVTSDDASYSRAAKEMNKDSFDTIANGCPGVEMRLPLLYTLGVEAGRLTLPELAEIFATRPARLFGLAPRKGAIQPGADADIVIIDPEQRTRLSAKSNYGPIGYTPFEGIEVCGLPCQTIRRGEIVVDNGAFMGQEGDGRYIHRSLPDTTFSTSDVDQKL
jgi:dihydropyrimidinase